jgi:hypothetical protein
MPPRLPEGRWMRNVVTSLVRAPPVQPLGKYVVACFICVRVIHGNSVLNLPVDMRRVLHFLQAGPIAKVNAAVSGIDMRTVDETSAVQMCSDGIDNRRRDQIYNLQSSVVVTDTEGWRLNQVGIGVPVVSALVLAE